MHQPQSPGQPAQHSRSTDVPPVRFKVVPLRLRSIKSDLEAYYWDHAAEDGERSGRYQISFWIRLVADRTSALEALVLYRGSVRLVVRDLDADTRDAVAAAAKILD